MRNRNVNSWTLGLAAAGLLVAGVAQAQSQHRMPPAQGKVTAADRKNDHRNDQNDRNRNGKDDRYERNDHDRNNRDDHFDKHDNRPVIVQRRESPRPVIIERREPPRTVVVRRYPVYRPERGVDVTRNILRQRGYRVVRVIQRGNTRYIYYVPEGRYYGEERWIAVNPDYYDDGRLYFENAPQTILQAILSQLY